MVCNKKTGFTLIELMFFFLFVTLILAASTPLITKKFKEIPQRINHGMFMCYYGDKGLTQDYYNAVKKVSSTSGISQCKFKPPKKAALFKIELYGAGAGGYNYHEVPDDVMEKTDDGKYHMVNGLTGQYYEKPKDLDLQTMFGGEVYQAVQSTGAAERGGSVRYSYSNLRSVGCNAYEYSGERLEGCDENYYETVEVYDKDGNPKKDSEGNVITKKVINTNSCKYIKNDARSVKNDLLSAITSPYSSCESCYYIYSYHNADFNYACTGFGGPTDVPINTKTTSGAAGGKASLIVYNNTISFKDVKEQETSAHLVKLWKAIEKGTATSKGAGFKKGGSLEWIANGKQGKTYDTHSNEPAYGYNPSDRNYTHGRDVKNYGAIKVESAYLGSCLATNSVRAKGGDGAQIYDDGGGCITHESVYPGTDASGVVVSGNCYGKFEEKPVGSAKDIIPIMKIETNLNTRTHIVGNGGEAGNYKLALAQSLPDDCIFQLGIGGAPIDGPNGQLASANALATSLVCNKGEYKVSALGGTNSKSITTTPYKGIENIGKTVFITSGKGGEGSLYKKAKPFTIYDMPDIHPGAGGSGSTIVDNCAAPYGDYKYIMDPSGKSKQYLVPQTCTPGPEYHDYVPAGSGSSGAIIISW